MTDYFGMEMVKAKVGDTVWVHGVDEQKTRNELRPVQVVHVFELWGHEHYVIEIPTSVDPILEVREPWTVSDSPDRPIGMWRNFAKAKP